MDGKLNQVGERGGEEALANKEFHPSFITNTPGSTSFSLPEDNRIGLVTMENGRSRLGSNAVGRQQVWKLYSI